MNRNTLKLALAPIGRSNADEVIDQLADEIDAMSARISFLEESMAKLIELNNKSANNLQAAVCTLGCHNVRISCLEDGMDNLVKINTKAADNIKDTLNVIESQRDRFEQLRTFFEGIASAAEMQRNSFADKYYRNWGG